MNWAICRSWSSTFLTLLFIGISIHDACWCWSQLRLWMVFRTPSGPTANPRKDREIVDWSVYGRTPLLIRPRFAVHCSARDQTFNWLCTSSRWKEFASQASSAASLGTIIDELTPQRENLRAFMICDYESSRIRTFVLKSWQLRWNHRFHPPQLSQSWDLLIEAALVAPKVYGNQNISHMLNLLHCQYSLLSSLNDRVAKVKRVAVPLSWSFRSFYSTFLVWTEFAHWREK